MSRMRSTLAVLLLALAVPLAAQQAPPTPDWVKRSNENAAILLDVIARLSPESAARYGIEGHDAEVTQIPLDIEERNLAAQQAAVKKLEAKLATEKDPSVRQDLVILIESAKQNIEEIGLSRKYALPYSNVALMVFSSMRGLLDPQIAPERRAAALVRLRKYTGLEPGYKPITEQAMAYTRSRLANPKLIGPFRDSLLKDIGNTDRYLEGIDQLFKDFKVAGYEQPLATFRSQIATYTTFLRNEVLPRATTDFREPEEMYRYDLRARGIDMPLEEMVSRAKTSFREIQNEMRTLAPLVAKEKGFTSTDYRDVIRELKKQQFAGDAILPHYQSRIRDIEQIIRDQHIVTLPERPMQFRVASEAETAASPAPHMEPPRMIGNTGEKGAFVLPLRIRDTSGKEIGYDDFTFDAASWTLTAHEGRPGHELQFASILEKGVSQARAIFAFNSVNVEGWALYAEAEMKPYEPLDGQLIALQHRLMRAARAFLDPGLQLGQITREEAYRVLQEDVVLSPAMATQEVERYTFRMPGQAPSYFVGYARLIELRSDVERMLGRNFDRQAYHDFVLAQGLIPPSLLREAVMTQYVKPRLAAAAK